MTTTAINYSYPLTKKEIVSRLFKDGHITIDELLELLREPVEQVPSYTLNYPWGTPVTNGGTATPGSVEKTILKST